MWRRAWVVFCLVLVAAGLTLAGCAGRGPRVHGLTAADILVRVRMAPLQDATAEEALVAITPVSKLDLRGTLQVTKYPRRVAASLTSSFGRHAEVVIDGTTYYLNTSRGWIKLPIPGPGNVFGVLDLLERHEGIVLVGAEVVNGQQTYHLARTSRTPTAGMPAGTEADGLWVRQSDFFPVRIVSYGQVTLLGETFAARNTLDFTSWNTGLTIHVPVTSSTGRAPPPA